MNKNILNIPQNYLMTNINLPKWAEYLFAIFLLTTLYFILGIISFHFSISSGIISSSIFFPEGVALAFILLYGKKMWPGVFLGELLLSIDGSSFLAALGVAVGNSLEAVLAYSLLSALGFNKQIKQVGDYLLLSGAILFVLSPMSAAFGVISLIYTGFLDPANILSAFSYWSMGNNMGQLLLAPLILVSAAAYQAGDLKQRFLPPMFFSAFLALIIYLTFYFFGDYVALNNINSFIFFFPIVVIFALRYNFLGAVLCCFFTSFTVQVITSQGMGPFILGTNSDNLLFLNIYIIGIALSAGLVGVIFQERKQREHELRKALEEVDILRGILPICASCKSIRDDQGSWQKIEEYLSKYTELSLSHGICETCMKDIYGDEDWYKK